MDNTEERFVIGSEQVARYTNENIKAKGQIVSLAELKEIFKEKTEEMIIEIDWYGSAIRARYI